MNLDHVETVRAVFVDGRRQNFFERFFIAQVFELDGKIFVEERHVAERHGDLVGDDVNLAILIGAINDAVKNDHFAIEPLEGADARVAVSFEIFDGD